MNLKQKIFKKLDEDGYISDTELAKIYGKEPNWTTAEEYKRQWKRLQADREYFANTKIPKAHKYNGKHYADINENVSYRIGKDYFNEIIEDMIKDNSRPDLKDIAMYKAK